MADMDLRQVRYFLAVTREGNFSRAAQRLGVTQPALSRAVRALERTVGAELFVRGPRTARLTDVGHVLAAEVADIDERAQAALTAARRAASRPTPLRVAVRGCDAPLAGRAVAACRELLAQEPVEAELVVTDPVAQPGAVRSGACELGLIRMPFDSRELHHDVWWTEPRVALVAADHPLATRAEADLADLADDPVVIGPAADDKERAYWAGADRQPRPWREGPRVRDSLEITAAVALGQAIAFVPASIVAQQGVHAGISQLRVRGLSPSSLALAWHESDTSTAVARFVQLMHRMSPLTGRVSQGAHPQGASAAR
ncbi:Hca operon transcriptional activator HcaR [Streptomyces sp. enrichment culture]|uniref:LysR family transcriptional regulator n=1 Tax=Streptomyces sp. enrichment culture TaxID=1795815 RepID=UPI003F56F76E